MTFSLPILLGFARRVVRTCTFQLHALCNYTLTFCECPALYKNPRAPKQKTKQFLWPSTRFEHRLPIPVHRPSSSAGGRRTDLGRCLHSVALRQKPAHSPIQCGTRARRFVANVRIVVVARRQRHPVGSTSAVARVHQSRSGQPHGNPHGHRHQCRPTHNAQRHIPLQPRSDQ